ncbi:MAG: membrane dipeptidase [Actinomycetota bacterium]|jgi:membrane dipeptidase|nr:membrane dipeptidase [Actinomycetota bacterium]
MATSRRSDDYTSFDYLEAGVDYQHYDLASELERVPETVVPLTDGQAERSRRLADECLMISMHDHPNRFPDDIEETPRYVKDAHISTAYEGLAHSSWHCVFDNLLDGICAIESKSGWKYTEVLHDLGMRLADLAHQDFVEVATSVADIHGARERGSVAWVATLEGAAPIENELDRLDALYGFGVRSIGVTYNEANALGSGLREANDGGLTMFGQRAVRRMNQLGMLIDCSHCGDQTTLDSIAVSAKPIVLSHIGARALWNTNRMAPDDVLKACADKGGVIGVEAAPHTTLTEAHPAHDIESVMEHFEYIADLVGIDHVGFGVDTTYGDHVGIHNVYSAKLSIQDLHRSAEADTTPEFEPVDYVKGLENPTEASHNIVRWLVRHDYSDADIAKVVGGNALRVLDEVWH